MNALSANPIFLKEPFKYQMAHQSYVICMYLNGKWAIGSFIGPIIIFGPTIFLVCMFSSCSPNQPSHVRLYENSLQLLMVNNYNFIHQHSMIFYLVSSVYRCVRIYLCILLSISSKHISYKKARQTWYQICFI